MFVNHQEPTPRPSTANPHRPEIVLRQTGPPIVRSNSPSTGSGSSSEERDHLVKLPLPRFRPKPASEPPPKQADTAAPPSNADPPTGPRALGPSRAPPKAAPGTAKIPEKKGQGGNTNQQLPEVFSVSGVRFEGVSGHAVTESQLREVSISLSENGGVYTAATEELPVKTFKLGDLSGDDGASRRRMSASALNELVKAVSGAYVDHRFAAIRVTILKDAVLGLVNESSDGVLTINVDEGTVADLRTVAHSGQDPSSNINDERHKRIKKNSPVQKGDIVNLDSVERYVSLLNRYPGRRVDVALAPGPQPHQLTFDYLITEANPLTLYFQGSNTGTKQTAEWRERFGLIHRNLTGQDDILSLSYTTGNFDTTHAVYASYERPLPDLPRVRGKLFADWSEYDASEVGIVTASFSGESVGVGGELAWNVFQKNTLFIDAVGGIQYRHAETENGLAAVRGSTGFLLPYVGIRGEQRKRQTSTSTWFSALLEFNLPDLVDTEGDELIRLGRSEADRDWAVLRYSAEHSCFLDPLWEKDWGTPGSGSTLAHELYLSGRGQFVFSDHRLSPSFTQTAGGFYTVRGYPESFTSADNAFIGTLEYRFHLPRFLTPDAQPGSLFGQAFRFRPQQELAVPDWDLILRAFLDVGRVWHNKRLSFERDTTLVGAGIGMEFTLKQNLSMRVDWGWAMKDTPNGSGQVTAGSSQVHLLFSLFY